MESGLELPFVPSKEIVGDFKDRFLPDDPKNLVTDAPEVPILCGLNSSEGILFFMGGPKELVKIVKNVEPFYDKNFPRDLKRLSKDPARIEAAKKKVRQFFMRGDPTSESAVANNYKDFNGDLKFYRGTYQMLKTYLNLPMREPIFLYCYDFRGTATNWIKRGLPDYLTGAGHGDDVNSLFSRKIAGSYVSCSEACLRVIEHMTTIWTNFAKFGNPNGDLKINWEPLSPNKVSHCKINEELKIQPGFIHEERMKFWDELHQFIANQNQNGT